MKTKQRFYKHKHLGKRRLDYLFQSYLDDLHFNNNFEKVMGKEVYFINHMLHYGYMNNIDSKWLYYYYDFEE